MNKTAATKIVTSSHTHSGIGVSRGAVAVCKCQRRLDIQLDQSECDSNPEIDVFTVYSGISYITELDDDTNILDIFNYFINDMIQHMKQQINVYACQRIRKAKTRAEGVSPQSILGQQKTVTVNEMHKFLVIIQI